MNITQINTAILQGTFTNDQLTSIVDAVKFARARLAAATKRTLRIGSNVTFDSTKLGRGVTGTVTKIAIKYVTVNTPQGMWRVPAGMLTLVEEWTPENADFNDKGSRHHY
jgi:small-conductance mechanosensitive channel